MAELATLPPVLIVASLVSAIAALVLMSVFTIEPSVIAALNATAPVPSNPTADAVISPLILKFCDDAKAVAVSALPLVSWSPAVLTPGRLISALPLKDTPPMLLAVVKVAALPVVSWSPPILTPGKSISALPLKDTPPIFLAVVKVAALPALPVTSPVTLPFTLPWIPALAPIPVLTVI